VPAEVAVRPTASLSPGELTRAELAVLALRRTTCLLLDEPTTHLDLASLEALEAALTDWPGAIVVASHDERFREALGVTRTLTLGAPAVFRPTSRRSSGPPSSSSMEE
jgi:ATPase subunit of ABC transporter with duplicated ATPase domains